MKMLFLFPIVFAACVSQVQAQQLDKPIMEIPEEDWDTCAFGKVTNLNPEGDNFLAVRSGPSTGSEMIDKIHTGDQVWIFNEDGDWIGIVYAADDIDCPPVTSPREYQGPGKKGWVFRKFIKMLAG